MELFARVVFQFLSYQRAAYQHLLFRWDHLWLLAGIADVSEDSTSCTAF